MKDFSVACKNSTECRFGLGCDPKSKGCSILFGVSCSLNTDCITVSKIENPSYAGSGCLLAKDYFNRPTSVKKPDGKVCVYLLKKGSQCSTTAQYSTVSNFYKCGQGFKCGASSGVCE